MSFFKDSKFCCVQTICQQDKSCVNLTFSPDRNSILFSTANCIKSLCMKTGKVSIYAGIPSIQCIANMSKTFNNGSFRNGLKEKAHFNRPESLVFSPNGKSIFVCDTGNNCIRKICNGKVTTFAGRAHRFPDQYSKIRQPRSIVCSKDGTTLIVCSWSRLDSICITTGKITRLFDFVNDITTTSLYLSPNGQDTFILDAQDNCIYVFCMATGVKQIFAGIPGVKGRQNGPKEQATFYSPKSIAISQDGKDMFVCDSSNHLIRRICMESGNVTTFAGSNHGNTNRQSDYKTRDGAKEQALFICPSNITFSPDGKFLIICDFWGCSIRAIKVKN
jgi:sugar lactone lactonase YvrE